MNVAWVLVVVAVIGLVGPAQVALAGFRGVRGPVPRRAGAQDRLVVLSGALGAAAVLVVARQLGDWGGALAPVWWALVLVAAVSAAGIVLRWADLPWRDPRRRGGVVRDGIGMGVTVLFGAAAAVLL